MSVMAVIIIYLSIGLIVGTVVAIHSQKNYALDFFANLLFWPGTVFFIPGYLKEMKTQKELDAQEAHKAKRQQEILDRIIIEPEDPEKIRFEEVFSNMPLTYSGKVCYICRRDTYDRYRVPTPLVDTVSTARVHKECLLKYIEEMK